MLVRIRRLNKICSLYIAYHYTLLFSIILFRRNLHLTLSPRIYKERAALKTMPTAIKRYYCTTENVYYIDISEE